MRYKPGDILKWRDPNRIFVSTVTGGDLPEFELRDKTMKVIDAYKDVFHNNYVVEFNDGFGNSFIGETAEKFVMLLGGEPDDAIDWQNEYLEIGVDHVLDDMPNGSSAKEILMQIMIERAIMYNLCASCDVPRKIKNGEIQENYIYGCFGSEQYWDDRPNICKYYEQIDGVRDRIQEMIEREYEDIFNE